MEALGMNYVALRDIPVPGAGPGVFAHRTGALVHESAVSGPDAWLIVGEDVAPAPGVELGRPAKDADRGAWLAYRLSHGADPAAVSNLGRDELAGLDEKAPARKAG